MEYIHSHPKANRLFLVGSTTSSPSMLPSTDFFTQLSDIASGLDYLHKKNIVHGDLKGVSLFANNAPCRLMLEHQVNVLVNNDYRAVIADFGLVAIVSTSSVVTLATSVLAVGGSERWMAPELLYPEKYGLSHSIPSKESDIYAFGMLIYEVCRTAYISMPHKISFGTGYDW